jgi:hypothetical protein
MLASAALDIIRDYRTCEFTTLFRDGSPQTWPVSARLLSDGQFLLCTSIGLPQKALNIRRNPKVSLLYSEPTGSGVIGPGAVLIQGDATAEDSVVTDMLATPDLAALNETVMARQPSSKLMSSWLGRRLFFPYYMRILIYVTPRRALYWPARDFAQSPAELNLKELRDVV